MVSYMVSIFLLYVAKPFYHEHHTNLTYEDFYVITLLDFTPVWYYKKIIIHGGVLNESKEMQTNT